MIFYSPYSYSIIIGTSSKAIIININKTINTTTFINYPIDMFIHYWINLSDPVFDPFCVDKKPVFGLFDPDILTLAGGKKLIFNYGYNLLFKCVHYGRLNCIELLLHKQADKNISTPRVNLELVLKNCLNKNTKSNQLDKILNPGLPVSLVHLESSSSLEIIKKPEMKTFANSYYKKNYDNTPVLMFHFHILKAIEKLVKQYQKESRFISEADVDFFMSRLNNSFHDKEGLALVNDVPKVSAFLWTSGLQIGGKELCSILNHAIRTDSPSLLEHALVFCRGINALCVTRAIPYALDVYWPQEHITYRGGGLPPEHQQFYTVGKKYRAPMFLASSKQKFVALSFINRVTSPCQPILWYFHFDPQFGCLHVNYLERSLVKSKEDEFLFSAYSVFTVLAVDWREFPSFEPHEVYLGVAPDNLLEPEDLPLAPWC